MDSLNLINKDFPGSLIEGAIEAITSHGSIVTVYITTEGGLEHVHFDYRPFHDFIEDIARQDHLSGGRSLIGLEVVVRGDPFDGQTIELRDPSPLGEEDDLSPETDF